MEYVTHSLGYFVNDCSHVCYGYVMVSEVLRRRACL